MFYGFDLLLKKRNEKGGQKKILKSDFNLLLCLQLIPNLDPMLCILYQSFVQIHCP